MPLLFNIVMEVLTTAIRQGRETKNIQIGREEVKPSLFAENIICYIENPNISTKKPIQTNKNAVKLQYKINIQKSVAFLCTNNEIEGHSREQRSKTWRSPSSPQIHQKYDYMWNNYRTPTECWQKTSDFPKGSWCSSRVSGLCL